MQKDADTALTRCNLLSHAGRTENRTRDTSNLFAGTVRACASLHRLPAAWPGHECRRLPGPERERNCLPAQSQVGRVLPGELSRSPLSLRPGHRIGRRTAANESERLVGARWGLDGDSLS